MSQYHEPPSELPDYIRNYTRILVSLKEEVEAVDWYNQRIELATDDMARRILEHNRNEEMEHACMALEWLRRNMPGWDEAMRTYLFTEADIVSIEGEAEGGEPTQSTARGDLGIGRPSFTPGGPK
jgi:hypothetical protein